MANEGSGRPVPRARDYMTEIIESIEANATGMELQQLLTERRISGCPVVERGRLVGVVSRSDLIRHLAVAQARAEEASDYYRDPQIMPESAVDEIAALSGQMIQSVRVGDLMSTHLIAVGPDDSLTMAAQRMLEHHVHRLLVLSEGKLLGVLTSQDLVRAIAAGPAA